MRVVLPVLLFALCISGEVVGPAVVSTLIRHSDVQFLQSLTGVAQVNSTTFAATSGSTNLVFFFAANDQGMFSIGATPLSTLGAPPVSIQTFGGGHVDGPPSVVQFRNPQGICGMDNVVYLLDQGGQVIRRIDMQTMMTSTFAGNATANPSEVPVPTSWFPLADARFNTLTDCVVYNRSTIYLVDEVLNTVLEIDLSMSKIRTLAGYFASPMTQGTGYANGPAHLALFSTPCSLAYDDDAWGLWIADSSNRVIRFLSFATMTVTTEFGNRSASYDILSSGIGFGAGFVFNNPVAVVLLPQQGGASRILAITDAYANRIWGANLTSGFVAAIAGLPGVAGGSLDGPLGVNSLNDPHSASFLSVDAASGVIFTSGNGIRFLDTIGLMVYFPMPAMTVTDSGMSNPSTPSNGRMLMIVLVSSLGGAFIVVLFALVIVLRVNVQLRTRLMMAIVARARSRELRRKAKKAGVHLEDSSSPSMELSSSSLSSLATVTDRRNTKIPNRDPPQAPPPADLQRQVGDRPQYPLRDSARIRIESVSGNSGAVTRAPQSPAIAMPTRNEQQPGISSVVGSLPIFVRVASRRPRDSDATTASRSDSFSTSDAGGLLREPSSLSLDSTNLSSVGHDV